MRVVKMLRWRRWEKWERVKMGLLIEWTYWIEKDDGRDRRWIVLV